MDQNPFTLNGQFRKEGEDYPCNEFPKPFVVNGIRQPGFEILLDCYFTDEIPTPVHKEKAPPCFDFNVMGLLFGREKNEPLYEEDNSSLIQTVLQSESFDPSKLITPAEGSLHG